MASAFTLPQSLILLETLLRWPIGRRLTLQVRPLHFPFPQLR